MMMADRRDKESTNSNSRDDVGPTTSLQDIREAEVSYLQSAILYQLILHTSAQQSPDTSALSYPSIRARIAAAQACANLPLRKTASDSGKHAIHERSADRSLFTSDRCYGLDEADVLECVSPIQPEELQRFRQDIGEQIIDVAGRINAVYDELYGQDQGRGAAQSSLDDCVRGIESLVVSFGDGGDDGDDDHDHDRSLPSTWARKQQSIAEYSAVLDQLARSQMRRVQDQKLGVASELIRESVARSREQNLALQGKIRREIFKVLKDTYNLEVCDELDKYKTELDSDIVNTQTALDQAQARLNKFLDEQHRDEFEQIAQEYRQVMDQLEEETNLNEKLKLDVESET